MTRARDSQRSRVYDAEDEYRVAVGAQWIPDVWEIQRWVNCIVKSDWWAQRFSHVVAVKVKDGRGRRWACAENGANGSRVIKLPRGTRRKMVILHEVAHTVTPAIEPWHGEVFVGRLLAFVDQWMGQLEGLAFRWFLSNNRVKWQELDCQASQRGKSKRSTWQNGGS